MQSLQEGQQLKFRFLLLLYLKLTNQIQVEWVYVFIPFIISSIGAFFIAAIAKNATNNENKN